MSERMRVAVIGAGRMGAHHARVYAETPSCELVAIVDKDVSKAAEVAVKYGATPLASIDQLPSDVSAVTVAVPTVYHESVAVPLMQRGIACLVEKPLAQNTESARKQMEASKQYGVVLQVGHSERFNPVVQTMLRMNVQPRFIETVRVSPFTFRSADVGVVFDMMIHDIDIVLHLARCHAYTVDAVGVAVLGHHEDVANARVRFSNGVVASLAASRLALKTDRRIRVFCPTAYITMDYQRKTGLAVQRDANLDMIRLAREKNFEDLAQMQSLDFGSMLKVEPLMVNQVEPLRAEVDAFLAAVRSGGQVAVSAEDGYAAVEMAERIITSIAEHQADYSIPTENEA